ncbi:hypothetical protein C8J57DRAFT_1244538 [Mycena rebaudengoi]|nr:hypothetical protein C8J57DRAFT_1244538 [Mycena rebaudengoi]
MAFCICFALTAACNMVTRYADSGFFVVRTPRSVEDSVHKCNSTSSTNWKRLRQKSFVKSGPIIQSRIVRLAGINIRVEHGSPDPDVADQNVKLEAAREKGEKERRTSVAMHAQVCEGGKLSELEIERLYFDPGEHVEMVEEWARDRFGNPRPVGAGHVSIWRVVDEEDRRDPAAGH